MNKIIIGVVSVLLILSGLAWLTYAPPANVEQTVVTKEQTTGTTTEVADYKNISYIIDGSSVELKNGEARTPATLGSASMVITKYFGNELTTDLNDDGRPDTIFLLTQETGGSGTFYYAVAALNTINGYVGSDGYLLGDRVVPQTTEVSQNPRQKQVVVVNYMDRAMTDTMTTQPSVGKSVYLKLDLESMRWAVVEPNFTGEADGSSR